MVKARRDTYGVVMEILILSRDSFTFSSFTKMIRSMIRSVTISSYYINTPAGGEKECIMCYYVSTNVLYLLVTKN